MPSGSCQVQWRAFKSLAELLHLPCSKLQKGWKHTHLQIWGTSVNRASFNPHKWSFIHAKNLGRRPKVRKLERAAAVGWMESSLELSGVCGWFGIPNRLKLCTVCGLVMFASGTFRWRCWSRRRRREGRIRKHLGILGKPWNISKVNAAAHCAAKPWPT